jgi:hypothetical protein
MPRLSEAVFNALLALLRVPSHWEGIRSKSRKERRATMEEIIFGSHK